MTTIEALPANGDDGRHYWCTKTPLGEFTDLGSFSIVDPNARFDLDCQSMLNGYSAAVRQRREELGIVIAKGNDPGLLRGHYELDVNGSLCEYEAARQDYCNTLYEEQDALNPRHETINLVKVNSVIGVELYSLAQSVRESLPESPDIDVSFPSKDAVDKALANAMSLANDLKKDKINLDGNKKYYWIAQNAMYWLVDGIRPTLNDDAGQVSLSPVHSTRFLEHLQASQGAGFQSQIEY